MRVFIDTRDLINIFNESRPLSDSDLGALFLEHGHRLVIPWSLISELVPADNSLLTVARRFVAIEAIPHTFLQQQQLAERELQQAAEDFEANRPPRSFDPFLTDFQALWGAGFDPIFLMDLNRTIGIRRMAVQVEMLVERQPSIFRWSPGEAARAVAIFGHEQSLIKSDTPTAAFERTVAIWLKRAGIHLPVERLTIFTKFLRANPRVAPGWRLYIEVFNQLARDKGYRPTSNDLWDLANITMLPYLDAATLDKNKAELVRRATHSLRLFDDTVDYPARTFTKIDLLLKQI